VARAQARAHYAVPIQKSSFAGVQLAQDAITFKAWLRAEGLDDAHLLWYLDYCCRDDYGAGIATVSAWAGLHYFASRHGFHAPGDAPGMGGEASAVFTWPQGNGWIGARLADLEVRLEVTRAGDELTIGGLLIHGGTTAVIDVAPLSPVPLRLNRRAPDRGRLDAGLAAEPDVDAGVPPDGPAR